MPKIQRETQKIFCNSAESDQLAVFGSMATGVPVYSNNIEDLQNNEAFDLGWDAATLEDKAPFMEEMNGMQYGITKQLAYNFQEGIPEYDAGTTYYVGSICKVLEEGKPVLYTSLTDENLGNNPTTDATNWERLSFGGGGLEIGDVGFTQMAIDETKGKRRILNGQLIIQEQYPQFTNIVKASVALNPDLACTEEEWQTAVTMSTAGICYKFVIDDEGGTIRLPKYPNYFIGGVNGIAPVVGNGIVLGLTDGTRNAGLFSNGDAVLQTWNGPYGADVAQGSSGVGSKVPSGSFGITTDPTKSGMEAQIKQEKIKGTYFIQVATGAETEDNIVNEIELNNPFSLFECKYSDSQLYNLSWLVSNGTYNGSNAIHPSAYQALIVENNAEIGIGSTVILPIGTQYTKRGLSVKLSTDTFTDYDFVLNTSEETFRLPIKPNFLNNTRYLVEEGEENGIHYRVYIDGYCEQWATGNHTSETASASGNANVTFVKTFANTEYSFEVTTKCNTSDYTRIGTYDYVSKSMSGVIGNILHTNSAGQAYYTGVFDWKASGYLAQGEYPLNDNAFLYYYVGETVQNANLINAGRIEEKLGYKLDRSAVKAYIVETYVNGTSGYRIWSDKYCEQWGRATGTSNGDITVSLLKSYRDTNYNISRQLLNHTGSAISTVYFAVKSLSTNSFVMATYASQNAQTSCWKTCGYLA